MPYSFEMFDMSNDSLADRLSPVSFTIFLAKQKKNLVTPSFGQGKFINFTSCKENLFTVHTREGKFVKETCQGKLVNRTHKKVK